MSAKKAKARRRAEALQTGPVRRRANGSRRSSPGLLHRVRGLVLPLLLFGAAAALVWIGLSPASGAGSGEGLPPPVLGEPDAPVAIVEYGDFQCPSCGAFFRSIEPQIRAAYIDTGRVRLEWHDFAWIGPESRDAANAARCAQEQDRFWDYHDTLYRNQRGENTGFFSRDQLKRFGLQLGLDAVAFDACVDGNRFGDTVAADMATVRQLGLNGTPTFVIGAQRIVGAQPFEVFAAAVDAELAAIESSQGTP